MIKLRQTVINSWNSFKGKPQLPLDNNALSGPWNHVSSYHIEPKSKKVGLFAIKEIYFWNFQGIIRFNNSKKQVTQQLRQSFLIKKKKKKNHAVFHAVGVVAFLNLKSISKLYNVKNCVKKGVFRETAINSPPTRFTLIFFSSSCFSALFKFLENKFCTCNWV